MIRMMSLPKLRKWFCSAEKGIGRSLDKKNQLISSEPLVQNQIISQKWSSCCPLPKLIRRSAWLKTMATKAKKEISLNHIISPYPQVNVSSTHDP